MSARPIITLLTDFGLSDHYVGAMKGVILGICPGAQLVDLSHEVTPYAIAEAAYTISQYWNCFPETTVHLVVVDPGVGSERRPIAVEAAGHRFVAPDNGVLSMVYDDSANAPVWEINATQYYRQPVSRTFHGRDIFSPIAAQLARGVSAEEVGRRIDDYVRLPINRPEQIAPNQWRGTVLKVDRFGNVITNFASKDLPQLRTGQFRMAIGTASISDLSDHYSGFTDSSPFVIRGSSGRLEISVREKSASLLLVCKPGDPVFLEILS
jgi:S-adenosylmethionine hydrolase